MTLLFSIKLYINNNFKYRLNDKNVRKFFEKISKLYYLLFINKTDNYYDELVDCSDLNFDEYYNNGDKISEKIEKEFLIVIILCLNKKF